MHPVATHGGNPRGRERRVRDRVLVLVAGAHIDRAAVRRWHRILSDAVARRYPTGVSSYCRACPCESGPLTRDGGNGCHTARPGVRRRDPTRSARGTSRRVARVAVGSTTSRYRARQESDAPGPPAVVMAVVRCVPCDHTRGTGFRLTHDRAVARVRVP